PLLDALAAVGPLERDRTTAGGRLASLENGVAHAVYEASLPLSGLQRPKAGTTPIPWTRGGVLHVTGEVTIPVGKRLGGGATVLQTLEGEAQDGTKTLSISRTFSRRTVTSIGGEMPEPPP